MARSEAVSVTAGRKLIEDEYSANRMTADYLRVYQEAIAAVKQ